MPTVPQSFLCPITSEIMADPVSTSDGFTYERDAITEWLASGNCTSPLTGSELPHTQLIPNHALRQTIQEFIDANPEAARDLYRPSATAQARPPPAAPAANLYPQVDPPPAAPLTGLRDEERAAAAPYAVSDWVAHCAALAKPSKPASAGWLPSLMGGSRTPRGGAASTADAADEPKLRATVASGGGASLEAEVHSAASILRLARRLAASGSAPVTNLTVRAKDGFGPGTAAPLSAEGDGFVLLCRALCTAHGTGADALKALRELTLTKLTVGTDAAASLALALRGQPTLQSLELWNVGLEDDGALALAQLARPAPDGNAALTSLNLGRNLLGPEARETLMAAVDTARCNVKLY